MSKETEEKNKKANEAAEKTNKLRLDYSAKKKDPHAYDITPEKEAEIRNSVDVAGMTPEKAQKAQDKVVKAANKQARKDGLAADKEEVKTAKKEQVQAENDAFTSTLKDIKSGESNNVTAGISSEVNDNYDYQQNLADTKKDVENLEAQGDKTIQSGMENTSKYSEEQIKQAREIVDNIKKLDPTFSFEGQPHSILMAAKNGEFGKFNIDKDVKKAYQDVMKKPKSKRTEEDQKVIDEYQKQKQEIKPARDTYAMYLVNAIGTLIANAGHGWTGNGGMQETSWGQAKQSKLNAATERYNRFYENAANEVIEDLKNKGYIDRNTEKEIMDLYSNAELRPYLDKLDIDTLERTIIKTQTMGKHVNADVLKDALMLQILENPEGAIEKATGSVGNVLSSIPANPAK